jgi:SNF2 family DNA or RNA helicase
MSHDIIITTYGTIATEYRKIQRRVLYHMRFFRIVLDEGSL